MVVRIRSTVLPRSPAPPSPPPPPEGGGSGREQSTIAFPYVDLETAITVADAMLKAGAVPMTRDQVAAQMGTSINSGSFLNKLSATRMFGLVLIGGGKVVLAPLAFSILDKDDDRQKAARAEAFMNVPLFKKVYDEFRNKQLPPRPHGLEQALVSFGVAPNQKSTARGTFDRSAAQAGYFPNGQQDRLVMPVLRLASANPSDSNDAPTADMAPVRNQAPVQLTAQMHPFIQGLIEALPDRSQDWPVEERIAWLQAAANNFALMYGPGKINVSRG